ncbi:MAG: hypothetical protein GF350_12830 [Chitinivibrionales bacterium]|nr:hypothetical protein [Chitinivibrionales bacterium]
MKHVFPIGMVMLMTGAFIFGAVAEGDASGKDTKKVKYVVGNGEAAKAQEKGSGDTLVIKARVVEIPGTFPPNDLYNYVYIMKYRVTDVVKGSYDGKEILVGHYNPLIPRKQIKDKMDKYVDGDVEKFEEGAKHKLVLIKPIDKVWQEALEDEYFDSEEDKYYALKANKLK